MSELSIEVKSITKEYPKVKALDQINFTVRQGSIHGLLGPNGAGKSSTMKIIAGLIPPTSGELLILGQNVLKNREIIREQIGLLLETPPLYENMLVEEYLHFVQKLNQGKNGVDRDYRAKVIHQCGLKSVVGRLIGNLSKGFKQRIGIAQALVCKPSIVILDEPTVSLDPNAIAEVRDLILSLKNSHTVLISTHRLDEASKICDEITIINRGKILTTGPLASIKRQMVGNKTIHLKARILKWTNEQSGQLTARFGIKKIEVSPGKDESVSLGITLSTDDPNQSKAQVIKFLSEKSQLIEFKEKVLELEDIFKEVVSHNGKDMDSF